MSRLTKLAALLLLALWLPATLHCQLELAGFGEPHHDECCTEDTSATGADCRGDACANVETSLIKESAHAFDLAAPAGCECFICCAALICPCSGCGEPSLSPARHAPPLELAAAWQFIERAAPPARAPGALSA